MDMTSYRKKWVSDPAFKLFKKVLPPLSSTEKEAMEAGSVGGKGSYSPVTLIGQSFMVMTSHSSQKKNRALLITRLKPSLRCSMTSKS